MPPTVWDHGAHLSLLQAIVVVAPPTSEQWDKILERVQEKGFEYTASAALTLINMPGQPQERMTWSDHANSDLLVAITQELNPSQDQLRGVVDRMHEFGYTCTLKAITQHLQKLRRKEGSGPVAEGATPKRKKAAPKAATTPKAGGKRKTAAKSTSAIQGESEDSDDNDIVSPTKKVKKEEPVEEEDGAI
ncbi:hypothetical protein B0T17DRAFT_611728 [Bombardia bombarda]|uniref:Uncharacterized protein n=1 Tax=Bombardia bombarda TaxID=252184 RepID=A0AA40CES4_9PEZI|nr:hypothetical protein B0T17DRAFT_611728 [Bombardia bombarda]